MSGRRPGLTVGRADAGTVLDLVLAGLYQATAERVAGGVRSMTASSSMPG
jgi:hypothetical protein